MPLSCRAQLAWLFLLVYCGAAHAELPARDAASDQVGATPGEFRVDESGNANYTIPLYAVPGTAGVVPALSLHYNAAAPDGPLGKGWSIGGMSAISRCRATREHGDFRDPGNGQPIDGAAQPIRFTAVDQFCLDGQRLLLVNGTHAIHGAEYRPELDPFTRVSYRRNPGNGLDAFKVQRKDGSTSWYGNYDGCVLSSQECTATESPNRSDARLLANGLDASGATFVRSEASTWMLARMQDSSQNYIDYLYTTDATVGEAVLSQVRYTGHLRYSGDPGTQVTQSPYATISFSYDALPAAKQYVGWQAGHRMTRSKRLISINSNNVRWYFLGYQVSAAGNQLDLLRSVKECANAAQTICLPATTFDWFEGKQQFIDKHQHGQTEFGALADSRIGDLDGDGRMDLVWIHNVSTQACPTNRIVVSRGERLPNGKWAFTPGGDTGICTGWDSFRPSVHWIGDHWQLLDYNGDGRDDLLIGDRVQGRWKIHPALANGLGFDSAIDLLAGLSPVIPVVQGSGATPLTLGDFNGDGVADIVYADGDASASPRRTIWSSTSLR